MSNFGAEILDEHHFMKKVSLDMTVVSCERLSDSYGLLRLTHVDRLPDMAPGQFVEILVSRSPKTFLRRPISINFVDCKTNELWLLVRNVGAATHSLINSKPGMTYNVVLPLGNGFSKEGIGKTPLLVGGGVGVAPLLFFGKTLAENGIKVRFALGGRSAADLLMLDEFRKYGDVFMSTDDGTAGEPGVVTTNSVFDTEISHVACCGPTPMMKAVAKIAASRDINCEVSLENNMACGLGACLCCVEDTRDGNVCVCTEGPVFNIKKLKWNI